MRSTVFGAAALGMTCVHVCATVDCNPTTGENQLYPGLFCEDPYSCELPFLDFLSPALCNR